MLKLKQCNTGKGAVMQNNPVDIKHNRMHKATKEQRTCRKLTKQSNKRHNIRYAAK